MKLTALNRLFGYTSFEAWGPQKLRLCRFLLGGYLAFCFFEILPYAQDVFSNSGMLPNPRMSLTFAYFPSPFWFDDSPAMIYGVIGLLVLASMGLAVNIFPRTFALILWYGQTCLLHRNVLTSTPSLPFIGWLLLVNVLLTQQKAGNERANNLLGYSFVWIVGLGYALSGYDKLLTPDWQSGKMLALMAQMPSARSWWFSELFTELPGIVLQGLTYGVMLLELLFLPLILIKRTRAFANIAMLAAHIGVLLIMNLTEISVAMLIVHLWLFDAKWFEFNRIRFGLSKRV